MVGVGQLMKQGDSFNNRFLLSSPLPQLRFGVPDLKKPRCRDFQQFTWFTGSQVFHGAVVEQSQPPNQGIRWMFVNGSPVVLGRKAGEAPQGSAEDNPDRTWGFTGGQQHFSRGEGSVSAAARQALLQPLRDLAG